jgi:hypothetical protein
MSVSMSSEIPRSPLLIWFAPAAGFWANAGTQTTAMRKPAAATENALLIRALAIRVPRLVVLVQGDETDAEYIPTAFRHAISVLRSLVTSPRDSRSRAPSPLLLDGGETCLPKAGTCCCFFLRCHPELVCVFYKRCEGSAVAFPVVQSFAFAKFCGLRVVLTLSFRASPERSFRGDESACPPWRATLGVTGRPIG